MAEDRDDEEIGELFGEMLRESEILPAPADTEAIWEAGKKRQRAGRLVCAGSGSLVCLVGVAVALIVSQVSTKADTRDSRPLASASVDAASPVIAIATPTPASSGVGPPPLALQCEYRVAGPLPSCAASPSMVVPAGPGPHCGTPYQKSSATAKIESSLPCFTSYVPPADVVESCQVPFASSSSALQVDGCRAGVAPRR